MRTGLRIAVNVVAVVLVAAAILGTGLFALGGAGLAVPWSDIPNSRWLADYGVTENDVATVASGFSDGTFRPGLPVSRGQFVKMVMTGLGLSTSIPPYATFTDVPPSSYYFPWVEGSMEAGITNGYGNGTFGPGRSISRQQADSILGLYLSRMELARTGLIQGQHGVYLSLSDWFAGEGADVLSSFADGGWVASEHAPAAAYLVFHHIVHGSSGQSGIYLAPQSDLTRAQAAALVLRVVDLPGEPSGIRVPILMYHYVDDVPPPAGPYADRLTVRTWDFVEEMGHLVANGYQTVSLADLYTAVTGGGGLPDKPVILTFDDGGVDNYQVAFPILKQYGLTATFFVITGTVGNQGQMDWDMLSEMAAAGMSIQSHTVSHPDLRTVSDSRLVSELVDSRDAISVATGLLPYAVAYPYGACDGRVIQAARSAGYAMAVVTGRGKEGDPGALFELRRRQVLAFMSLSDFEKLLK